jgi:hypothetical protein
VLLPTATDPTDLEEDVMTATLVTPTATLVTPTATLVTPTAAQVTSALLRAIVERDVPALRELFAPDGWFGHAAEVRVLMATTAPAGSRELLRYRLRLRPHWAPDVWHVIEQTGYARIADGRVRRLDLLCTGFVPET